MLKSLLMICELLLPSSFRINLLSQTRFSCLIWTSTEAVGWNIYPRYTVIFCGECCNKPAHKQFQAPGWFSVGTHNNQTTLCAQRRSRKLGHALTNGDGSTVSITPSTAAAKLTTLEAPYHGYSLNYKEPWYLLETFKALTRVLRQHLKLRQQFWDNT